MKFKHLFIVFLIVNLICLSVAWHDKRLSKDGAYGSEDNQPKRIAEVQLVTYSAFGGSLGMLMGFYIFHHKTSESKAYLRNSIYLLMVQNFLLYFFLWKAFGKKSSQFLK